MSDRRHRHDDDRGDTITHDHDGAAGHRHGSSRVTAMDLAAGTLEDYDVEYGAAYPAAVTRSSLDAEPPNK